MKTRVGLFLMSKEVGEPWGSLGFFRISTDLALKLWDLFASIAIYTKHKHNNKLMKGSYEKVLKHNLKQWKM